MEAGRARGLRDHQHQLPPLSLSLSSVRFIVNKLEADYSRALASNTGKLISKYDPSVDDDDYDPPLKRSRDRVGNRFLVNLAVYLSRCIPSVTFGNIAFLSVLTGTFAPRMISYLVVYPFCRLVFGTLYPAYASYKAVRTKNLKEYVKWMMYWIVFALFTCTETFTDVFLSWFPFYYEVKIVLVLWLLSPATKGSSILYRKFVHPALCRREQEIDEYIAKAKDQGYHTVLNLGTKGVNYATTVIMQTAIKGGGGLVQQLRKSYSLSDLSESVRDASADEADDVMAEPTVIRGITVRSGYITRRSVSETGRSPIYFPEVDVNVRAARSSRDEPDLTHIKSSEDISSGYSSADNSNASLSRTASVGGARPRARPGVKTSVTAIKRPQAAEDSEVIDEEHRGDDLDDYTSMPPLMNVPSPLFLSHSNPPFIYQYVGDQIKIVQVLGDPLNDKSPGKTIEMRDQNVDCPALVPSTADDANITDSNDNTVCNCNTEKSSLEINSPGASETKIMPDLAQIDVDKNIERTDEAFFEIADQSNNENLPDCTKNFHQPEVIQETEVNTAKASPLSVNNDPVSKENETVKSEIVSGDGIDTERGILTQIDTKQNAEPKEEVSETTSLNASVKEVETDESDDEASYGTPENSPRSTRKSSKGKYGKGKAPPPPKTVEFDYLESNKGNDADIASVTTSQESLVDIVNALPNTTFEEGRATSSHVVNPISENKRRHKSKKSPGKVPKGNSSTIGKLLQLPAKFVFWNKHENKPREDRDSMSLSDHSRRSSTIDNTDDFHNCSEFHNIPDTVIESVANFEEPIKADDQISFKDASDLESEVIIHDIMEKSDALQKLIEAKIESHPEYKFVSEDNETPTTVHKSTETQV